PHIVDAWSLEQSTGNHPLVLLGFGISVEAPWCEKEAKRTLLLDGLQWLSTDARVLELEVHAECLAQRETVVDTLRKLCGLKSLLDTWHSRDLVDRPWIMCPRPPRVLLDILGINTLLIGHPTIREPPRAFQKSFWRQRELSSLFLLPLCFSNPIPTSPSTRSEY
ncbi:hypothetical protein Taro_000354, partial [Colocasia esculenta]|nr:hypothetical protein [Colocasia esculenta]